MVLSFDIIKLSGARKAQIMNNDKLGPNDNVGEPESFQRGDQQAWSAKQNGYGMNYGYGYGAHEDHADEEDSFGHYWHAVVYRKRIVAIVLLAGLALGYIFAQTRIPVYRSTAMIEIEKVFPHSAVISDLLTLFGQSEIFYQTQIELLRSQNVVRRFLEMMNEIPQHNAVFKTARSSAESKAAGAEAKSEEEKKKAQLLSEAVEKVQATPVRGTQLIEVQMEAEDPHLAQQMLGAYVGAFIEETQRKRSELADKLRGWLRKELEETERQLRESERDLHEFTVKHGIIFLDNNPNHSLTFFNRAGENLAQSKDSRLQLEALDQEKDSLPPQASNEYLNSLKSQLTALKSEYTSMKAIYGPDYFKMGIIRNKIQSLENAIAELEKSALSSALETAKKKEELAGQTYEKQKEDVMKLSPLAVQYQILKRMVDANGQVYVTLLQKYKQAAVDNEVMGHNIIVSSAPTLPMAAVYPNKTKIMGIAALLALLGGIACAIGLEQLDRTVKTTGEVEKHLNIPILGLVPKIGREKRHSIKDAKIRSAEFLPYGLPVSPFADAIRIVQHTVAGFVGVDSGVAICVSSALPLEGKTFIAISMATAVASENRRSIVIDADMRRPRVQEVFQTTDNGVGLTDLLTGKITDLKRAVQKSHVPGLFFMSAGTLPRNPVALLKSKTMEEIVEACKKAFDFVIIDAPPVLGLADATIISRYTNGLILVAKQGHTSVDVLRQAQDAVVRAQGRPLGVVLNMAEPRAGKYYYYNTKYYQRYYHRENA